MIRFFPLIFVILWSSAFITTKPITDNSDPFSALAFRFLLVAFGFFVYAVYKKEKIIVKNKFLFEALSTGILFHGIVIRGETSHYDLVTNETFRSIGSLAENFYDLAIINNVICVENEDQLKERLIKVTLNNTNALIDLINEKSS